MARYRYRGKKISSAHIQIQFMINTTAPAIFISSITMIRRRETGTVFSLIPRVKEINTS
jgi:hypothetical protein